MQVVFFAAFDYMIAPGIILSREDRAADKQSRFLLISLHSREETNNKVITSMESSHILKVSKVFLRIANST